MRDCSLSPDSRGIQSDQTKSIARLIIYHTLEMRDFRNRITANGYRAVIKGQVIRSRRRLSVSTCSHECHCIKIFLILQCITVSVPIGSNSRVRQSGPYRLPSSPRHIDNQNPILANTRPYGTQVNVWLRKGDVPFIMTCKFTVQVNPQKLQNIW